MKTLLAVVVLASLAACKKPTPKVEEAARKEPVPVADAPSTPPAQSHIDASPSGGAELIRKAQEAAKAANADVKASEQRGADAH
jgi:hypothetical protein